MERIYLDHNATTPLRAEARAVWLRVQDELTGNPSSLHAGGRRARHWIDEARERVAAALGVGEDEVVFTSGATEANNLALLGGVRGAGPGARLVTSAIEHSSVLAVADALEREGHPVERVGVDAHARLDVEALVEHARGAAWLAVQAANGEVGTVVPLAHVGARLRALGDARPRLHVDAVQALGRVAVDLDAWGADTAAFSAHKVGGPVGVGVLVRRARAALRPVLFGGEQEAGLRPGTEDAAGIVAASVAIELAVAERERYRAHTGALVRALWDALRVEVPDARLLGPPLTAPDRLPNTLGIALAGCDGRVLVTRLDLEGLAVSAGSACASGSLEPSHVLLAMGMDAEAARAGLRVSVGRDTTRAQCDRAVDILRIAAGVSHAT